MGGDSVYEGYTKEERKAAWNLYVDILQEDLHKKPSEHNSESGFSGIYWEVDSLSDSIFYEAKHCGPTRLNDLTVYTITFQRTVLRPFLKKWEGRVPARDPKEAKKRNMDWEDRDTGKTARFVSDLTLLTENIYDFAKHLSGISGSDFTDL